MYLDQMEHVGGDGPRTGDRLAAVVDLQVQGVVRDPMGEGAAGKAKVGVVRGLTHRPGEQVGAEGGGQIPDVITKLDLEGKILAQLGD